MPHHFDQDDNYCYENEHAPWPWGPAPRCSDCNRPISHHTIKQPSRLCQHCQLIDFSALRCPTLDQLNAAAISGVPLAEFDARTSYPPSVALGTLARIKYSTADCAVCSLVWDVMVRNNYMEEPALIDDYTGREPECFVSISAYGNFSDPIQPSSTGLAQKQSPGTRNLLRRLSLRVGVPPAGDEDNVECGWWTIWFCVQATNTVETKQKSPMMVREAHDRKITAFGGRLRPFMLDIGWIREWMHICAQDHATSCTGLQDLFTSKDGLLNSDSKVSAKDMVFADFRLINVLTRSLEAFVAIDENTGWPAYAALSYVWGKDQRLKLLANNEERLMRPGALDHDVPSRTIVEAMDLVAGLKLPAVKHIWVDALCIVQDRDEDKKRQIARMGQIYMEAAFSIIAASGEDADAGLPGIRLGSRVVRQNIVPVIAPGAYVHGEDGLSFHPYGLSLMATLNPLTADTEDFWTGSKYESRGWTMQEKVLSARNLIFTDEQVFWECPSGIYCEESNMEPRFSRFQPVYRGASMFTAGLNRIEVVAQKADEVSRDDVAFTDISNELWNMVSALAVRFSRLEFTGEGDALDAFSGITQRLTGLVGERFLWGMPESRFNLALLWEDREETFPNETYMRRRTEKTTLPVTSKELRVRFPSWSWLAWTGMVGLHLGDTKGHVSVPEVHCYAHDADCQIREIGADTETKFPYTPRMECYRSEQRSAWEQNTDRLVTLSHVQEYLPALHQILPTAPEGILLFFWTSISSFRIHMDGDSIMILSPKPSISPESPSWENSRSFMVHGQKQYWVGSLYSRGDQAWNKDSTMSRRHEEEQYDFIVEGRMTQPAKRTLVVMLVAFRGEVAMRLGLGTINEDAWVASRPEWKLVALG